MIDATLPLQKAIIGALRKAAAIRAIVDGRSYDSPPANAQKPYVSIGPVLSLTEIAQDYGGADITIQIDGWSSGPQTLEIKQLGAALHATLHEAELELTDQQRLVALTVEFIRYLPEPDGITQHAVCSVRARTEPTD
jgi:hypothetical protein